MATGKLFPGGMEIYDFSPGDCRIIINSGSVEIENHRGLSELDAECICVLRRKGVLRIRGAGMEICAMNRQSLIIKGRIIGVDME